MDLFTFHLFIYSVAEKPATLTAAVLNNNVEIVSQKKEKKNEINEWKKEKWRFVHCIVLDKCMRKHFVLKRHLLLKLFNNSKKKK